MLLSGDIQLPKQDNEHSRRNDANQKALSLIKVNFPIFGVARQQMDF